MNFKNFIKLTAGLLIMAGSFASCGKGQDIDMSKIDFSNIENLYAQPLQVIQKCVQGEWKWVSISRGGIRGYLEPHNTFVEITEKKVIITQAQRGDNQWLDIDLNYLGVFSYDWKKRETLAGYTAYIMWDTEQNRSRWYFDKIQNDTLYVIYDTFFGTYKTEVYTFVKIK